MPDGFLVCEVCFCPSASLAANRFMMQTRFNKKNTGMDNLCSNFHCLVGGGCRVARICFECSPESENLAKAMICVCPVSHCQVGAEINVVDKLKYTGPVPALIRELPVHFRNVGVYAAAPVQLKPMPV